MSRRTVLLSASVCAGLLWMGPFTLAASTPGVSAPMEVGLDRLVEELPQTEPTWDETLDAAGALEARVFRLRLPELLTLGPGLKRVVATLPGGEERIFFRRKFVARGLDSFSLSGNVRGEPTSHWALTLHHGELVGTGFFAGRHHRFITLEPGVYAWIETAPVAASCAGAGGLDEND